MQSLLESLYAYNDWANAKIVALGDGLTDEQLDAHRPMGFGTLRATIFHILTADQVWMERWMNVPWRPFPKDPEGMSLTAMSDAFADVATRRAELISREYDDCWNRIVEHQDSTQKPFKHQLHGLLLHVFQHGVHHRAQCLHYLKALGRTVPGGIDYLFYKLARGSTKQANDAIEQLTQDGLGVNESIGEDVKWEPSAIKRLFEYTEWATAKVLDQAAQLDDETLDRPVDIGPCSIRKNLLHTFNAEKWWGCELDRRTPAVPANGRGDDGRRTANTLASQRGRERRIPRQHRRIRSATRNRCGHRWPANPVQSWRVRNPADHARHPSPRASRQPIPPSRITHWQYRLTVCAR